MNSETYTYEDKQYLEPTLSRDEQLGFVDKLRQVQQSDINKIAADTHALGTDVSSNLGGLSGSEERWSGQYVQPRVNAMIDNLKATAQASALNIALKNYQEQLKERYNEAYASAQKRAASAASGGNSGNVSGGGSTGVGGLQITDDSRNQGGEATTTDEDTVVAKNQTTPYKSGTLQYIRDLGNGIQFTYLYDSTAPLANNSSLTAGKDGQMKTVKGKTYIAMNGEWYPVIQTSSGTLGKK